jgi:DNA-binding transcriptional LysR family regulator
MELRHLRYFLAVAENKGFVKASSCVHIAQPALSRQIRDLERELGVRLFERSRLGVSLTFPGECFLKDVQRIFSQLEEAQSRARRAQSGYSGALSIGVVESFAWHETITQSLQNFQHQCPDVVLNVALMASPEQLAAIRDGRLSAGFLFNRDPDDETLEGVEVLTTRAVLAVPENSPYAKRPPERLVDLRSEDFVFIQRAHNPSYYDRVIHACHNAGFTPRIVQSGTNDSSNLCLVAAGLGLTIVPAAVESRKPRGVVLVPVGDLSVESTMELVWRRDSRLPALENFVEILQGKIRPELSGGIPGAGRQLIRGVR